MPAERGRGQPQADSTKHDRRRGRPFVTFVLDHLSSRKMILTLFHIPTICTFQRNPPNFSSLSRPIDRACARIRVPFSPSLSFVRSSGAFQPPPFGFFHRRALASLAAFLSHAPLAGVAELEATYRGHGARKRPRPGVPTKYSSYGSLFFLAWAVLLHGAVKEPCS